LRNIVLIGFMGAGKTAVGQALAAALHRPFLDTDVIVEETTGATIDTIFETLGEEAFRELENQAIESVKDIRGAIVSTGGGAIKNPANATILKRNNFVIYLAATPEELFRRIAGSIGRPLAGPLKDVDDLRLILVDRDPAYRGMADLVIDTTNKPLDLVRHEIFQAIGY
jgi:shikimate kinase